MKTKSRKAATQTSSFGSPGRRGHDASRFYAGKLYEGLPQEGQGEYWENPLDASTLNTIFCKSAEDMAELPEAGVHLMVTSPPYNVGKDYDEDLTLEEYLAFLKRVWQEVHRVLVPGGRACINVANLGRRPYIPLHAFIIRDMLELGFLMRGEIIWNKAASASPSTAWGSWKSPANPALRDVHEYILVFSKGNFSRKNPAKRESTITREEFLEYTKSVWTIQLYTFKDEIVLDPFMGSGQTAIAAIKAGRHYVGYEIDAEYVKLAEKRVKDFVRDRMSPTLFPSFSQT
jgi:site-specific DNA-methyltransferase (adenine-specific)